MKQTSLRDLAERAMDREHLDITDARAIADVNFEKLEELLYEASRIRTRNFGRRVSFCSIVPGQLGGCSQDCAWCGQSAKYAGEAKKAERYNAQELLQEARRAKDSQTSCFCVVNSGCRPTANDLDSLQQLNDVLMSESLPPACASLGILDDETAVRLHEAGVVRYNHNLETSPSYFSRVVTTHHFEDRLETLRAARAAGMAICSGGIFGIGERWEDRIELALILRDEIEPDVVPLNFLDAREGTPLANASPLTPQECLHIVALFRFLLPTTDIKIAGGRRLLRDLQSWLFHAGATSLMVGDYLTTQGRSVEDDLQMVRDLGLELVNYRDEKAQEQPA